MPLLWVNSLGKRLHPCVNSRARQCLTFTGLATAAMMLIFHGVELESYNTSYYANHVTVNCPKITTETPDSPLGNLVNFRYTINSDRCGKDPVFTLLLIGSHPDHLAMRNAFRQIWADPSLAHFPFKIIFPFGQPVDPEVQLRLLEESSLYGDIIQGNFVDAYHNVTVRDLMGTRWAWQRCPQATFVIHVDDDMSVDVFTLINSLRKDLVNHSTTEALIACAETWHGAPVSRTGRYKVERSDYSNDTFDPYCLGWLYVFNPAMAKLIDAAALTVKPFWMNDAYITGTLVRVAGRQHQRISLTYAWEAANMREMDAKWNVSGRKPPSYTLGPQDLDVNLTLSLHRKFIKSAMLRGLVPKMEVT